MYLITNASCIKNGLHKILIDYLKSIKTSLCTGIHIKTRSITFSHLITMTDNGIQPQSTEYLVLPTICEIEPPSFSHNMNEYCIALGKKKKTLHTPLSNT